MTPSDEHILKEAIEVEAQRANMATLEAERWKRTAAKTEDLLARCRDAIDFHRKRAFDLECEKDELTHKYCDLVNQRDDLLSQVV